MDNRKITIAYTKEKAVSPYFVERKNTENWNVSECFATLEEARAYIVRMMDEYPTIPWRILVHRRLVEGGRISEVKQPAQWG